jgi:hypothetical protein
LNFEAEGPELQHHAVSTLVELTARSSCTSASLLFRARASASARFASAAATVVTNGVPVAVERTM